MATPVKFVGDLRGAVSSMIDSYSHAMELVQFHTAMGWDEVDFEGQTGGDLTASQFMEAIASLGSLAATFGAESQTLARLKY
jgi:hypothetical protein